ncbi:unnamed protein product [Orchesella dallaii]|uniref:Glycoside hydrolase family 19 catalytic domain-containing protein n=1 Tax=Orchesella dallaii TaxID=48710 RepID=A0ABP1RID5_9HEXA
MQTITVVLLILGVAVSSIWANCWWTGCQPNHWGVKGCAQYDRDERGTRGCRDNQGAEGKEYNCCQKENGREFVSYERFRDAVTKNGGPAPSRDVFNNFNTYARSLGKIEDTQEAAMALAQFIHESDGLVAKREYACQHTQCPNGYRDSRCDRPGQYYYGRGYIQLSWCYNYGPASQAIFGDDRLLENPDQVATNDQIAWQTSFWFWGDRVHGQNGVAQGQFGVTTRRINGGIECGTGSSTPQKRFQTYGIVREAFGLLGAGDPSGC